MSFVDYLIENIPEGDEYKNIGEEHAFMCPFCRDEGEKYEDYKFYVKSVPGETELWICFRCSRNGNPQSFVMEYEGLTYPEALNTLHLYGLEDDPVSNLKKSDPSLTDEEAIYITILNKGNQEEEEPKAEQLVPPPSPRGYIPLVGNYHLKEAQPYLNYLYNRGVTDEDIVTHSIGFIYNGHALSTRGKRITLNNHVVFLTKDFNNNYLYWNTRAINNKSFTKTVNAPNKDNEYGKSDVLFNLNNARDKPFIVLTEGVFDALTIPDNRGIASFGKKLSEEQINLLISTLNPEQKLFLFYDDDAINDIMNTVNKLYSHHKETYIVMNGSGLDVNDLGSYEALKLVKNNSKKADEQGSLSALINLM